MNSFYKLVIPGKLPHGNNGALVPAHFGYGFVTVGIIVDLCSLLTVFARAAGDGDAEDDEQDENGTELRT